MAQHFTIDSLKKRLAGINEKFSNKHYFLAKDAAEQLYNEAVEVEKAGNITEVLLDAIYQVQEDMIHAYDFSNFDAKEMVRRLKYASSKSNPSHVTESPEVLATKANSKYKKGRKK